MPMKKQGGWCYPPEKCKAKATLFSVTALRSSEQTWFATPDLEL